MDLNEHINISFNMMNNRFSYLSFNVRIHVSFWSTECLLRTASHNEEKSNLVYISHLKFGMLLQAFS